MRKPLVFTYPPCIDGWKRIAGPNNLRHYSLQSPAVRPDRNASRRVVRRLFHCGKSGKRSPARSSPKCLLELDIGSQQQFLIDETRPKSNGPQLDPILLANFQRFLGRPVRISKYAALLGLMQRISRSRARGNAVPRCARETGRPEQVPDSNPSRLSGSN